MGSFVLDNQAFSPEIKYKQEANIQDHKLYDLANKNRIAFWEGCAEFLVWYKSWHTVLDWDPPFAKWFDGGKINACVNCLDRFIDTAVKDKYAILWEGEDGLERKYTYEDLYKEVNRLSNALKNLGVKKGDCVAIYLPMVPEAICSMLACARIGAIHTVIFGGFSDEALRSRIVDANAKILITADGGLRKGKIIELKKTADVAVDDLVCLEKVVVVQRTKQAVAMKQGRDFWYHELIKGVDPYCSPEIMDSEDPLFILYTSGTTGKPKGIIHSTAGYLVGANMTTRLVFDIKPKDVFWCTADIGWITGHTYIVYGPLSNGMTQLIYEGSPDRPNKGRFWDLIDKYKITTLYTAPTAIRMFMKWGLDYLKGKDLSSLRLLGSVGEPLNPEAWMWYYKYIGKEKCPIVDTWWQTETGSILLTCIPSIMNMKPGSVGKPLPGIEAKILDDHGNAAPSGFLSILSPWPSMLRGIHGDTRRFVQTYWNKWNGKYYFPGDGALIDKENYIWIAGRVDDTINVSAHRIGTMEVESALIEHNKVAEAAVVGVPDDITGQAICAFVVLKDAQDADGDILQSLKNIVVKKIGAIARPKKIYIVEDLPKTRSGKIMRRLLKDLALGRSLGDITTLENENLIEDLNKKIVQPCLN